MIRSIYMTWHLIGPGNLITHYFGMKTVRFESQEYTFSDNIIYFGLCFRLPDRVQKNPASLNFLFRF